MAFRACTSSIGTPVLRTETLNGREYIVAPVIPIKEGVLNGEFVPFNEISVFPEAWDGRPLPINHPTASDGSPITANDPKIMEDSVIGFLFNVNVRDDIRGISGELWIDTEKAATVVGGDEVIRKLNASEPLEVSTGYFVFIDKVPGEFKNPDGTVEKFIGSQSGIRPDHLALLPFDIGACSWEDGCGAPRTNKADILLQSQDIKVDGVSMADNKTKLQANGVQLGRALSAAIAAHAGTDGSIEEITNRLAVAANVDKTKVQALIEGKMDFAPRNWLVIFSAVLDIDGWDVLMAASNDNSDVRFFGQPISMTNNSDIAAVISPETINAVTIPDNKKSEVTEANKELTVETEHTECSPCQKSITAKVQELVKNTLTSIGIRWNEQEKPMDKKQRVDALIASDKTQFSENHKDWLLSLNEDQLTAIEPKVETIVETKTEEVVPVINKVAAVVAPVTEVVATQVAAETKEPIKVLMSRAEILSALGASEDEFSIMKAASEQKKTVRNSKITEIAALANCPYSKDELAVLSDSMLDKTLDMLTPETPFRAAAGVARQSANTVPAPPAILLARPAQEVK